MPSRLALMVLAAITGGDQVIDGIHVLVTGRYLGPETPGPWSQVVTAVGLDPFDLGPGFVVLGTCWLAAAALLVLTSAPAAWWSLLVVAVMTLWYLPVGTFTALTTIAILVLARTTLVESGHTGALTATPRRGSGGRL
jgi:hypothetical protein